MPNDNKYGCTVWKNGHTIRRHNKKISTVRKDDRIGVIMKSIQPEEELQFNGNIIRKNMKQTVFGLTYDAAEMLCALLAEELKCIKDEKLPAATVTEKVIKDGKYAVVHTNTGSNGWFTAHHFYGAVLTKQLLFSPKIVEMILSNKQHEMTKNWFATNFPKLCKTTVIDVTAAEKCELAITWVPVEAQFTVIRNNGTEIIRILHSQNVYSQNS